MDTDVDCEFLTKKLRAFPKTHSEQTQSLTYNKSFFMSAQ